MEAYPGMGNDVRAAVEIMTALLSEVDIFTEIGQERADVESLTHLVGGFTALCERLLLSCHAAHGEDPLEALQRVVEGLPT